MRTGVALRAGAWLVGLAAYQVLAHWAATTAHGWPPAARILPLLPQLAICLGLAWMFGRTLLAGREPLVTRMARSVHGGLPAPIVAYTRNVTLAWTLFLSAMAVTSALLFLLAPLDVWSLFANVLFFPLVGLMFLAEYAHRILRYRWFAHASIAQSVAAFRRQRPSGSADQRAR
ncbi:MAG TPA: hypothetical protein VIA64_16795 [Burkholderiales bacterium]